MLCCEAPRHQGQKEEPLGYRERMVRYGYGLRRAGHGLDHLPKVW